MKTIKQKITFKASPHDVYEALLDEKKHSAFTGSKAKIGRKVGGKYSVYDGWITGANIELVQDKKIVQTWIPSDEEWPKKHESVVTFEFKHIKDGKNCKDGKDGKDCTELNFIHSEIPDDWVDELTKGWEEYYWKPMKKMLENSS